MNSNNINFHKLWYGQKIKQITMKDFKNKLNSYKKENRMRLFISNLIFFITTIIILLIWFYYQPKLISTKIGMVISILAMIIFIIPLNQDRKIFKKSNETKNNYDFLNELFILKEKQTYIHTTMLNIYFVLLSFGIGLYIYEYTFQITQFWTFFVYGIFVLWILFNWFYVRPLQIKKQQTKLNEIIYDLESIIQQLAP
jgi:membrane protein YdbS with pleckstrin-like domain